MADRQAERLKELKALKNCLEELESHAEISGAGLAAHLIGAASKAIDDEIFESEAMDRILPREFGIRYDA